MNQIDIERKLPPIVRVSDLTYEIDGRVILADVSFEVFPGELFGVMGMSGSGKSTLLRCLMGLISATSGEIEIDGKSIIGKTEDELNSIRRKMSMCFQQAALFDSMSVAENVAFGLMRHARLNRDEISSRVHGLLDAVELADYADYMPADLSGGMKKRVGIARALALHPSIVLYDEPTSGLDPLTAGQINRLILQLGKQYGTTSIVVTHEVTRLFAIADRVMMIDDQTIAAMGTPEQLLLSEQEQLQQFIAGDRTGLADICSQTPTATATTAD
jgi:phospholipid/cholesterol/gamma-HCH transport system ATP-binding protein